MVSREMDGEVIEFPVPRTGKDGDADSDLQSRERFEHPLDEDPEDEPQPVHPAGGFPIPHGTPDRRSIVPPWMQSREAFTTELRRHRVNASYPLQFHGLRAPWYLVKTIGYAIVGTGVISYRLHRWCTAAEATPARLQAAVDNDGREWRSQQGHQRKVSGEHVVILSVAAIFLLIGAIMLTLAFPLGWIPVGVLYTVLAAWAGQPAGRPIITPSMVEPIIRVISQDTLIRAYAAAGLCKPDTAGQELGIGVMSRDARNKGTQGTIILPYGKTFADVVTAKTKIASGLDVKVSQIFFTEDEVSERRHTIYIADEDPLAVAAGRSPLLDLKRRNVWRDSFPMGLDHFGRKAAFGLLWVSFLIGAQPRKGKTFTARALALFCALDPSVRITVADGSAKPDWRKFTLVAHRTIFGTRPTLAGDPVENLIDELRSIEKHMEETGNFLSTLDTTECPEGKLTEELCRKYPKKLFLWLLVMEEAYFYFETDDQEKNKEIAQRLSNIRSAGPALGVILITSLQKPAGVGSGDVARLFNRYRDNHEVRIALKCGNRIVSEAVLGGDAYAEGWDASALPDGKRYRGVSILYGHPDLEETLTVRAYLADGEDAERILTAARKMRESAGTLSGDAIGEDLSEPARDVIADVLQVFRGDPALHWTELAERLEAEIPERWDGASPAELSAQLRDRGIQSVPVKRDGEAARGCRKAHVEQAQRGERVPF